MSKVRTRVAPSPTGDPHVGTAYMALFNLAFARQYGGEFILRIEDTDQARSTLTSEQALLESLKWLGLQWDEGPDCGGEYGPYRQSERRHMYADYAKQLVEQGDAFYCFATAEELDEMRRQQMAAGEPVRYDGRGLQLSTAEVSAKLEAKQPYVIRMKVPEEGVCVIDDMLRGPIEIEWSQVDMQVLLKADGMPTYHLANVVDDHLMRITHVIRGEEWINSAPKHQLLYRYLNWEMPKLCHMPLLRNPDKSKLSKRKNPTGILYYQRLGILPEALVNYLGRMGWSMPDEREKFTLTEMFAAFDIQRVSLGGPVFDTEKLRWLNGQWMREELSEAEFAERYMQWAFREELKAAIPHIQPRVETFSDVAPLASFLLSGMPDIKPEHFTHKHLDQETQIKLLQMGLWQLEAEPNWTKANIESRLFALCQALEVKVRDGLFGFFIAIAGTSASFSVFDSMSILGPDMSRARIRHALAVLGGVSKKALKKLEKEYKDLSSNIETLAQEKLQS
jgi:glutamyl-tRNA synthetase